MYTNLINLSPDRIKQLISSKLFEYGIEQCEVILSPHFVGQSCIYDVKLKPITNVDISTIKNDITNILTKLNYIRNIKWTLTN